MDALVAEPLRREQNLFLTIFRTPIQPFLINDDFLLTLIFHPFSHAASNQSKNEGGNKDGGERKERNRESLQK